jgi:hypothetical protein
LTPALELFARTAEASTQEMQAGYLEFARWRMVCDALPHGVVSPTDRCFLGRCLFSATLPGLAATRGIHDAF